MMEPCLFRDCESWWTIDDVSHVMDVNNLLRCLFCIHLNRDSLYRKKAKTDRPQVKEEDVKTNEDLIERCKGKCIHCKYHKVEHFGDLSCILDSAWKKGILKGPCQHWKMSDSVTMSDILAASFV